jgi:hypothetical protein
MLSIGSKALAIHLAASYSPAALTRLNPWAYASFNSFSVAAALPADDLLVRLISPILTFWLIHIQIWPKKAESQSRRLG